MSRRAFRLHEAVQVDGATYLGSDKGYDIFDILTWDAAQAFFAGHSDTRAGSKFTQNQSTFNANINDNLHLYFFVEDNTNYVKSAALKGRGNDASSITIKNNFGSSQNSVSINVNFCYENLQGASEIEAGDTIPLYLIPNIDAEGVSAMGCLYEDRTLLAVLPQFANGIDNMTLEVNHININSIDERAFYYGQNIELLVIGDNIENLGAKVISPYIQRVAVETILEKPESWSDRWNEGAEDRTEFGYGLSEEDKAEIEAQMRAAEEAAEAARRAEAERAAREAALAAEREARKIRYRVEGDHIVITGTRKGVTDLEIPQEIDGKPVTKIDSFAFYDNDDLERVRVPMTIKQIGRGAFFRMGNVGQVKVPSTALIGRDNPNVRKV